MSNAIEQARRKMYEHIEALEFALRNNPKPILFGNIEQALVAYLEELRKDRKFCEDAVALSEAKAAKSKEECDTLRDRLKAFEAAIQTSAEIIKGLRAELDGASYGENCTIHQDEQASKNAMANSLLDAVTLTQGARGNTSSAKTDPYTLGYSSVGKCSNPFPINTVERLHWYDGFKDAKKDCTHPGAIKSGERSGYCARCGEEIYRIGL